jgi:hypothetical protein
MPVVRLSDQGSGFKIFKSLLIIVLFSTALTVKVLNFDRHKIDFLPVEAVKYMKSTLNVDSMRLYNSFNTGAYLEFEGIRTFVDPRAEVFFKSHNKKEDIMKDYFSLLSGSFYYKDFIAKYKLTHFLAEKGSLMDTSLKHDEEYARLYEDDKFALYTKVESKDQTTKQ